MGCRDWYSKHSSCVKIGGVREAIHAFQIYRFRMRFNGQRPPCGGGEYPFGRAGSRPTPPPVPVCLRYGMTMSVPLVIAQAPVPYTCRKPGAAVFSGMLGVTFFGIFLTPVFYYVIQGYAERRAAGSMAAPAVPIPDVDESEPDRG